MRLWCPKRSPRNFDVGATALLEALTAGGVTLQAKPGGGLMATGNPATIAQHREAIRQHKTALLALLADESDEGQHQPQGDHRPAPGLAVEAWTPAGARLTVQAHDEAHAAWLRKVNPKPASPDRHQPQAVALADVPKRVAELARLVAFEVGTEPELCLGLLSRGDVEAIDACADPARVDAWECAARLALARQAEGAQA